jgi:intracellular septation protein A
MKDMMHAGRLLLLDMASTLFFLAVFTVTKSIPLSVALGIALGFAQIGWEIARKKPIDTMQWVSLVIVIASGTATLLTNDPRFMMLKLSVIYVAVGVVMMKPGWLNRYQPAVAMQWIPDIVLIFGFVWSGLMFFSAALNLVVAFTFSVAEWAAIMSLYGTGSKLALFAVQVVVSRYIGQRRHRAQTGALQESTSF